MISHFRKGQQIRANDMNDITNAIAGRMIGGAGINVRKMAGGAVIDADVAAVAARRDIIPIPGNVLVVDANSLRTIKTKIYEMSFEHDFNISVSGNNLVFGSHDNPVRILDKRNLSLIDEYFIPGHGGIGRVAYLNTVTDESHIYACYFKGGSGAFRFYVDKYDFDFNLIMSVDFADSEGNENPWNVGINNTENYLVMGRRVLNKDLTTISELDTIVIFSDNKTFCADDYFVIGEVGANRIRKYNLSGVTQATFNDSSSVDISANGVTADGSAIYWGGWREMVSGINGGIYKLNESLVEQDSVVAPTGTDLDVRQMVTDTNYLYAINLFSGTGVSIAKYNKSNMTLVSTRQISYAYDTAQFYPQAMTIDNGLIYIAGAYEES